MAYRIYTQVNYAETSRDADDIHYSEVGYKHELEDAVKLANDYIKENFFRKDTVLHKGEGDIVFKAVDFRSWGEMIVIQEIKIT